MLSGTDWILIIVSIIIIGGVGAYAVWGTQSTSVSSLTLPTGVSFSTPYNENLTLATDGRYIAPEDKATLISGTGASTNTTNYYDVNSSSLPLGKVFVSGTDTTPNYLQSKLSAGSNISFVHQNIGGNEVLQINSSGSGGSGTDTNCALTGSCPDVVYGGDNISRLFNDVGYLTTSNDTNCEVNNSCSNVVYWQDANIIFVKQVDGNSWYVLKNDFNTLGDQRYYLKTNPDGYITSAGLASYLLAVDANNLFAFKTDVNAWGDLRYYPLNSNPLGYLTSASLSGYVPYQAGMADLNLGAHNIMVNGVASGGFPLYNSGNRLTPTGIEGTQLTIHGNSYLGQNGSGLITSSILYGAWSLNGEALYFSADNTSDIGTSSNTAKNIYTRKLCDSTNCYTVSDLNFVSSITDTNCAVTHSCANVLYVGDVTGGASDGNVYSLGVMRSDNNAFLLDVNTGIYRLVSNQVIIDRNGLQVNPVSGAELAPALTAVNWTLGTGWASTADLNKNADGTGTAVPNPALTITAGVTYKVVMTVAGWTTGKATWTLGGTTAQRLINSNETITEYVKATNTNNFIVTPTNTSRFRITVLSIKQVNTGWIYPSANAVNALGIAQADGRPYVFFDTTNKRIGIDQPAPAVPLEIQQTTVGGQSDVLALTNFDTTVGAGVCTRFKTGAFGGGSIAKICGFITNVDANIGTAYGNSAMTMQTRQAGSVQTRWYLGPTGESFFGKITNSPPFPYRISQMTIGAPADITLTGTTTTNNSTTIIGTGTVFRLELGLGDRICLSSAPNTCAYVTQISNTGTGGGNGDTNVTVSAPLGDGTTQTILRKKSLFRIDGSTGTEQEPIPLVLMDDLGNWQFGGGVTPNEKVNVAGNLWIQDSNFIYFGASKNASIKYDGTDLNINPKSVGSGKVNVNGDLKVDGNYYAYDGTVGFTGTCTILGLTSIQIKNGLIVGCS